MILVERPTINTMTLVIAVKTNDQIVISTDGLSRKMDSSRRWIDTVTPKLHKIHDYIAIGVASEGIDEGLFEGYLKLLIEYCQKSPKKLKVVTRKVGSLADSLFDLDKVQIIIVGYDLDNSYKPISPKMYKLSRKKPVEVKSWTTIGQNKGANEVIQHSFHDWELTPEGIFKESNTAFARKIQHYEHKKSLVLSILPC